MPLAERGFRDGGGLRKLVVDKGGRPMAGATLTDARSPPTSGEGTVPQARNFRIRPGDDRVVDLAVWCNEPRLPLRSRAIVILVAAATCWAVPLLLVYWLAR
jgi:hypothetical protein